MNNIRSLQPLNKYILILQLSEYDPKLFLKWLVRNKSKKNQDQKKDPNMDIKGKSSICRQSSVFFSYFYCFTIPFKYFLGLILNHSIVA